MRHRLFPAFLASLLLLAGVMFAARQGVPARALTNCDTSEDAVNAAEQQMLDLINQARSQTGLGALKFSPALNRAAAWKSADGPSNGLGGGFSHTDSLGRTHLVRFRDCGYPYGGGENVAYGSTTDQTIFDIWMASPGHRANILLPGYR